MELKGKKKKKLRNTTNQGGERSVDLYFFDFDEEIEEFTHTHTNSLFMY